MKRGDENSNDEGWEYGDDWKQGTPEDVVPEDNCEYVEILRGDIGTGYDDSYMLELVTYLGSRGVRATYDAFSLGLEPAAIKTYVLKAEAGREDEAKKYLMEKFKEE